MVYATNNELGFDYLRDNMAFTPEQKVQRDHSFAIVDEVDSILIDEARTPLIISGPAEETPQLYVQINKLIPGLTVAETPEVGSDEIPPGDFTIDEKQKQVYLTEEGMAKVELLLVSAGLLKADESLYLPQNLNLVHHLNAGLRAQHLFNIERFHMFLVVPVRVTPSHPHYHSPSCPRLFYNCILTGTRYEENRLIPDVMQKSCQYWP